MSRLGLAVFGSLLAACVTHEAPPIYLSTPPYGVVHHSVSISEPTPYEVSTMPPDPLYEQMSPAPGDGYVWIDGSWHWNGTEWVWVGGRWEQDQSGLVYVAPYYDNSGDVYVYTPGYWATPERVPHGAIVRDHRDGRPTTFQPPPGSLPPRPPRPPRPPLTGDHHPPRGVTGVLDPGPVVRPPHGGTHLPPRHHGTVFQPPTGDGGALPPVANPPSPGTAQQPPRPPPPPPIIRSGDAPQAPRGPTVIIIPRGPNTGTFVPPGRGGFGRPGAPPAPSAPTRYGRPPAGPAGGAYHQPRDGGGHHAPNAAPPRAPSAPSAPAHQGTTGRRAAPRRGR